MVASGNVGLIEAANRYDAHRGVSFQTFAYYRIRGAIFDDIRRMLWLPPSVYKRLLLQATADQMASEQVGNDATSSESDVDRLADGVGNLATVYVLLLGDEDSMFGAPGAVDDPATTAERREMVKRLEEAIHTLPDRQKSIIHGYYFEGRTLKEIAADFGISRYYASRIHTQTIRELRRHLESPRTRSECASTPNRCRSTPSNGPSLRNDTAGHRHR